MGDSVERSQSRIKGFALYLLGVANGIPGIDVLFRLLILFSQAVIWIGLLLLVLMPPLLGTSWKKIIEVTSDTSSKVVAILILALVILICYGARKYQQRVYGVTEIFMGLFACWVALAKRTGDQYEQYAQYASGLAIVGGVYLGVRGMVNIFEVRGAKATSTSPNQIRSSVGEENLEPSKKNVQPSAEVRKATVPSPPKIGFPGLHLKATLRSETKAPTDLISGPLGPLLKFKDPKDLSSDHPSQDSPDPKSELGAAPLPETKVPWNLFSGPLGPLLKIKVPKDLSSDHPSQDSPDPKSNVQKDQGDRGDTV